MFSKVERKLSLRYLKSRKRTGFVSVIAGFSFLGIMLGVATLIIVMSVMRGFKTELMERVLGLNGQLGVYPIWGSLLDEYDQRRADISDVKGIVRITPVVDGQVMASANDVSMGAMVRGIAPADFVAQEALIKGYQGLPIVEFQEDEVILGYRLAQKMALRPGDTLTLVSPKGNITAFGTIPKMKAYTVVGTFNSGMFEYDNNLIFMPFDMAQKYLMVGDKASRLEIFIEEGAQIDAVLEDVFERIKNTNAEVYDWRHSNQVFFNAIEVERNVMFLILTLIIVVASFNMISGLIMLVQDKTKDIAILRTMGMTKGGILRIFLMSGLMVGVVGTLGGVALGLLFSYNIDAIKTFLENLSGAELFSAEIYFLSRLPAEVNLGEVAVVTVMSLVLSLLSTLYPSWRASKTEPVEALRYE
ncbi:MAG: lipoprotein-releasing ABC transporter permease subunit [Lactobacillales bacterium]|jgi:lipoprotein-releasing system permease protein|nr:lipoprotein-releasing ABC transporter permease subunit [Lactobacillales bacterium]